VNSPGFTPNLCPFPTMKQISFITFLLTVVWFMDLVAGRVDGPFGLYTKSSNPAWNLRVISIGARNGYASITDAVSQPSQIPSASINFFINTTATLTPDASYGQLSWGAQPPYSTLFGRIDIVDPTAALQPVFYDYTYSFGYSSHWNFTSNKKLLLNNQSRFYAKELHTTQYNYPAVHWLFGTTNQNLVDATAITIWRYDP